MLFRPEFHLDRLAPSSQWEATRRHPVYLQLWQIYQTVQQSGDERTWHMLRREPVFLNACSALRIFGPPVDPSLEFSELGVSDVVGRPAFLPLTVRTIVGVLADMLSAGSLREIADKFELIADGKDELCDPKDVLAAFSDLLHSDFVELGKTLEAPFFSLSPVAPREGSISEMVQIQSEWRERFGLSTHRDRSDRHADYFRAWDLREGWSRGAYHREQISTLRNVARRLQESESTVGSWYNRAFQLISGHEFFPDTWIRVMGLQQLSKLYGVDSSPVALRRSTRRRSSRHVDITTLTDGQRELTDTGRQATNSTLEHLSGDQIADRISRLIADGLSNTEILEELDLDNSVEPAIEEIRSREDLWSST